VHIGTAMIIDVKRGFWQGARNTITAKGRNSGYVTLAAERASVATIRKCIKEALWQSHPTTHKQDNQAVATPSIPRIPECSVSNTLNCQKYNALKITFVTLVKYPFKYSSEQYSRIITKINY